MGRTCTQEGWGKELDGRRMDVGASEFDRNANRNWDWLFEGIWLNETSLSGRQRAFNYIDCRQRDCELNRNPWSHFNSLHFERSINHCSGCGSGHLPVCEFLSPPRYSIHSLLINNIRVRANCPLFHGSATSSASQFHSHNNEVGVERGLGDDAEVSHKSFAFAERVIQFQFPI